MRVTQTDRYRGTKEAVGMQTNAAANAPKKPGPQFSTVCCSHPGCFKRLTVDEHSKNPTEPRCYMHQGVKKAYDRW